MSGSHSVISRLGSVSEEERLSVGMASVYYTCARDELVERIKLRDSSMSIFLSSVSAIGSLYGGLVVFLGASPSIILYGSYLLVLICILANAAAAVVSQHHVLVGAIENYLVTELDPVLRQKGVDFPQWDSSRSVMDMKNYSIMSRSTGHQLLIVRIALTSAVFFIILQITLGRHVAIASELLQYMNSLSTYVAGNKIELIQMGVTFAATFVALRAVWLARSSLSASAKQRRIYMDNMNEYIRRLHASQ